MNILDWLSYHAGPILLAVWCLALIFVLALCKAASIPLPVCSHFSANNFSATPISPPHFSVNNFSVSKDFLPHSEAASGRTRFLRSPARPAFSISPAPATQSIEEPAAVAGVGPWTIEHGTTTLSLDALQALSAANAVEIRKLTWSVGWLNYRPGTFLRLNPESFLL